MNKYVKLLLLGLIAWGVPFISSFFVWDVKVNAPLVSAAWFYALMGVTGAIGFAIAAYYQFRNVRKDAVKEGWTAGITWYVELMLLDLIFLVGLFGMTLADYYHLILTYLTPLILSVAIGYIKK
ncbi:MAG: hypothetical protein NTV63_02890 [Candidatus Woesearchaeota archaeon]|nr:hypothetical protein [Candidatus Woesearchaeota archaeon]